MAHAQQQILDALQALLAAGATVAGTRVYVDSFDALQAGELPAIVLEEGGESAEPYTIHSLDQRELAVQVHCVIAHASTAKAAARDFGLAVEKLIAADATLAGLCRTGWRMGSSRPAQDGDTERALASRVQGWTFSYLVSPEAPDIIL